MEAVIEQAEALTAQYPGAYVVWNILGASRAQIGMLDEAVEAYKTSISLKPDLLIPSTILEWLLKAKVS